MRGVYSVCCRHVRDLAEVDRCLVCVSCIRRSWSPTPMDFKTMERREMDGIAVPWAGRST